MVGRGTAVRFLARISEFCYLQPDLESTWPLIQRLQETIFLEWLEQKVRYIVVHRITTFLSKTDRINDGGPIIRGSYRKS